MPSLETIKNQISSIAQKDYYLKYTKKEIEELQNIMQENEKIKDLVTTTLNGKRGLLIATNNRLFFIEKNALSSKFDEFSFDRIDWITLQNYKIGNDITISIDGNILKFEYIPQQELTQFVENLKNMISVDIKITKNQREDRATYFGGHFKYPLKSDGLLNIGETTKTGVFGKLILFDDKIVFENLYAKKSKQWSITIPFDRLDFESLGYEEKDTGFATVVGGGMSAFGSIGLGGGFISKLGNMNLLVFPYLDENGIKQAPKFQVKGLVHDKTNEWAQIIYDKIVEIKKVKSEKKEPVNSESEDDFTVKIKKLKSMYENGLITDEEFESKKKYILDQI